MPIITPQSPMRFMTKAFFAAVAGLVTFDVVTNQQVRTQPNAFPADEHQQEVVREHKRQHREHEQVQIREKAVKAFVAVHVPGRENVDEKSDEGDEAGVDSASAIHPESEIRPKPPTWIHVQM